MSETPSREELHAEFRALRSKADAKFERLLGEIKDGRAKASQEIAVLTSELRGEMGVLQAGIGGKLDVLAAKSAGKLTIWGAALSVIAAVVATLIVLLQVAQTGYQTGFSAAGARPPGYHSQGDQRGDPPQRLGATGEPRA